MLLPINDQLRDKLDGFCRTKIIPNILFHGSSGSGKNSIVLDFVSRIYNNNAKLLKENMLFINCSQGKGIKYIREELKTFAKYNIHVSHEIPFKTIIMLNFDNLSVDAQSVMRRIIEQFINTRFFIIVENKYKLLNPIISRFCSIYIPEHIINGEVINLHQYQLNCAFSVKGVVIDYILDILCNIDAKNLIDECAKLYEMGVSCIDLIDAINESSLLDEVKKTDISMKFYILKREYRCEKLLMFRILQFLSNLR